MREKKIKIKINPIGKSFILEKPTNGLEAIVNSGNKIKSVCGGKGTCGKCRIIILDGKNAPVSGREKEILTSDEIKRGIRLACQQIFNKDTTIYIPSSSLSEEQKLQVEGEEPDIEANPVCNKYFLNLKKATLKDIKPDFDRINEALRKEYKVDAKTIDLKVLSQMPSAIRENLWKVTATLRENPWENEIISIEGGNKTGSSYGIAVDLGTTKIAVLLVDLLTGRTIDRIGIINPQIRFGEDIINRIVYANKKGGLAKLREVILDSINDLILKLLAGSNADVDSIVSVMVSGNSTMMHLFYGVPPRYIREEPYVTVANKFSNSTAKEIGIKHIKNAHVYSIQGVASYLGGDISSGILATGMYEDKELSLFLDLGTNGELVVGNSEWMMGCSCSAGPAFEGGGVKCGIRAVDGAIERVSIDQKTYKCKVGVIGGGKPRGICGSGLIDMIGEMYLKGVIDRKGKFNKDIGNRYLRCVERDCQYVLVNASDSATKKDIYISEVDINNLIRAKAAIYAGVKTLLEEVDLSIYDLKKIYIAGGLGKHLNIRNAVVIGMLPDIDINKYFFMGNTSVTGAYLSLLSENKYRKSSKIAEHITYIELSVNMKFMERYVAGLFLPYTDMKDFPTVEESIYSLKGKKKRGAK